MNGTMLGKLHGTLFEPVFERHVDIGFIQISVCTRDFKTMFKKGDIARWIFVPQRGIDRFEIIKSVKESS